MSSGGGGGIGALTIVGTAFQFNPAWLFFIIKYFMFIKYISISGFNDYTNTIYSQLYIHI